MNQYFGRTRIKVCGVRTYEVAMAAVDAGADAIGFVFARSSPRFIEPEAAYEIMVNLPPLVATVGVFTDPTIEELNDAEEACPTTHTQLDGSEPERFVKQAGPDVIRTLYFDEDSTPQALLNWDSVGEVGAIRVDGQASGGGGGVFDWGRLTPMLDDISKSIFLAGGLTPDNVSDAIRLVRPFAVDVSGGVESAPGEQDTALIEEFCRAVREADRE
jgi:phosphoribosylanthranilate isomerase